MCIEFESTPSLPLSPPPPSIKSLPIICVDVHVLIFECVHVQYFLLFRNHLKVKLKITWTC